MAHGVLVPRDQIIVNEIHLSKFEVYVIRFQQGCVFIANPDFKFLGRDETVLVDINVWS